MSKILIDWLQFTVKTMSQWDVIKKVLKLDIDLFQGIPYGKLGYKSQLLYNDICVLYDGKEDMGVHVIISGKGCRYYEHDYPMINIIYRLNRYKGECTRIDIALDDHVGDLIPLDKMEEDVKAGNLSSRWKTTSEHVTRNTRGRELGKTLYFGNRTSNVYMRIYNKALEQNTEGIWYRMELEIKKSNAVKLQNKIRASNMGKLFRGILNSYIKFLVPNPKDYNRSRWETRPYWNKILDSVEKIFLGTSPEAKTMEEKMYWIYKQAGPSLAMISLYEGSKEFVSNIIDIHAKQLTMKNKKLLDHYMLEKEERLNEQNIPYRSTYSGS